MSSLRIKQSYAFLLLSCSLIEEGGDWDRRNRLKVYEGIYAMSTRSFAHATELCLEAVATFTSYELMSYQQFVRYTVLCAMLSVERPTLKEKVSD